MAQLQAKLKGVPQALKKNDLLSHALQRVGRKMFGEIGQYMVMSSKRNFSNQVSPAGVPWAPNAPRTVKQKGHARILFKTGAMNRGIQIVSLDNNKVSVGVTGTEAKKGKTHQFGREKIENVTFKIPAHRRKAHTKMVGGKTIKVKASNVKSHTRQSSLQAIPVRPFLGFSEPRNDIQNISKIVSKHLQEEARRIAHGN